MLQCCTVARPSVVCRLSVMYVLWLNGASHQKNYKKKQIGNEHIGNDLWGSAEPTHGQMIMGMYVEKIVKCRPIKTFVKNIIYRLPRPHIPKSR